MGVTHGHTELAHSTLLFARHRRAGICPRSRRSDPATLGVLGLGRGHPLRPTSQRSVTPRQTQAGTGGLATNFIQLQIAPSPWGRSRGGEPPSRTHCPLPLAAVCVV